MSKKRQQSGSETGTLADAVATLAVPPLPPSYEDWQAEVDAEFGPATSDGPRSDHADGTDDVDDVQPDQPAVRDEPNGDMTPPWVDPNPWWEVSCPEFGLPRRDVQAPTAEVAATLYNQSFNLRRPVPTVKRLETASAA